jgi:hypothetical protein
VPQAQQDSTVRKDSTVKQVLQVLQVLRALRQLLQEEQYHQGLYKCHHGQKHYCCRKRQLQQLGVML